MERMRPPKPARAGVFMVGLGAYWPQFAGLRETLERHLRYAEERIAKLGAEVTSAGLIDTEPDARIAGGRLAAAGVDLVFCLVGTYATASLVLPVLQGAHAPAVVLNLQPVPAVDYATAGTAEWLAQSCTALAMPEIANACRRAGLGFRSISGLLYPEHGPAAARAWQEIAAWIRAAAAVRALREARLGFLGHTYPGMLDLYTDHTRLQAQLGPHVQLLEVEDLTLRTRAATTEQIAAKRMELTERFQLLTPHEDDPISAPIEDGDLEWSARVAVGLDGLVADFDLDGIAFYHRGLDESERVITGMIPGMSLLTAAGVPCGGEGDIKTVAAMLLLERLDAAGCFSEIYGMDFNDGIVLLGHDGPTHLGAAEGRPQLRKLRVLHGKAGSALSIECRLRPGPATALGLGEAADGGFQLIAAQGTVEPGPALRIGNTNSRVRFPMDPAQFVDAWCQAGPTHHCALGLGHQSELLQKAASLLGVPLVSVCA
ncbi:MAG TPA: L-fucose/L-arabinose isomerase family protein [Dehalococcoidia bacterium]